MREDHIEGCLSYTITPSHRRLIKAKTAPWIRPGNKLMEFNRVWQSQTVYLLWSHRLPHSALISVFEPCSKAVLWTACYNITYSIEGTTLQKPQLSWRLSSMKHLSSVDLHARKCLLIFFLLMTSVKSPGRGKKNGNPGCVTWGMFVILWGEWPDIEITNTQTTFS